MPQKHPRKTGFQSEGCNLEGQYHFNEYFTLLIAI